MPGGGKVLIPNRMPARVGGNLGMQVGATVMHQMVNLNLDAAMQIGMRHVYIPLVSNSGMVAKFVYDSSSTLGLSQSQMLCPDFTQDQMLSDLGIGARVFGTVNPTNLPMALPGLNDQTLSFRTAQARVGLLMENLSVEQGWVNQQALDLTTLSAPVLEQVTIGLLESYATLMRAGYMQTDSQYMVNTRTGEVRIVGSGTITTIDPQQVGERQIFNLAQLMNVVGNSPRVTHALRAYNLGLETARTNPLQAGDFAVAAQLGVVPHQTSPEMQIEIFARSLADEGKGEVLSFEGEETFIEQGGKKADNIYILLSGEAYVLVEGKDGTMRREIKAPIIGEIGALLGMGRSATVVARPGAQILRISVDDFRQALEKRPQIKTLVNQLISQRLTEQAEYFFRSEQSVKRLFGKGELPARLEHPQGERTIPYQDMVRAYQTNGSQGLAALVCRHAVEEALRGNVVPLKHWMNVVRGRASAKDALYIFEMFQTGQLHIHPTRSCTPEFVMQLGQEGLKYEPQSEFWQKAEAKVASKPYLKQLLAKTGYASLREIFVRGDVQALTSLMVYSPEAGKGNLNEYLQVGGFISSLVSTPEQIEAMALNVARSQYQAGTRVMELRFSIDPKGNIPSEKVLEAYARGLERAEAELPGMKCRAIVIFDTVMTGAKANARADKILSFVANKPELGRYVVGVDTAGPEVGRNRRDLKPLPKAERLGGKQTVGTQTEYHFDIRKFRTAFAKLQNVGIRLTSHGGENFGTLEQGFDAIQARIEMGAIRIGHGVILGLDIEAYIRTLPQSAPGEHVDVFGKVYTRERVLALKDRQAGLLKLVAQKGIVVEACPDSNLHTSPITYRMHPIRRMMRAGVRVTINNDNAVLDNTSGARQTFAIGRAQMLSLNDITELILSGVTHTMDMVEVMPVKEELKQPHRGEVVEVKVWDALQRLRALANDPTVSQFQFMNELVESLTEALPEVEASYVEVNGEVLFSRKTYTEKYAQRMADLEREYEARFDALNQQFHNGEIDSRKYATDRQKLKRRFAREKGSILGGYAYKFPFFIQEGGCSFKVELRFFAASRAAIPHMRLRRYYKKRFAELLEAFISNNVKLELPDPLTPANVKSREWALFKLDPLADFYRRLGKRVAFGIFDADYFKGFNDGGNYLLGDDAIAVLNMVVERAIRIKDVIMPVRNGGDEVAILFADASPVEAERAVKRTDRILYLTTSIPLNGRGLDLSTPQVGALMEREGLADQEAQSLVNAANDMRAEIARRIKSGEFRSIESVDQFNQVFGSPRLVSDVAAVGEILNLDQGRVKIKVAAGGFLYIYTPSEKFSAQIEVGTPQKIVLSGREYVVKVEKSSGTVSVYHEVKGMRISGGIGHTMQEASTAQMQAKDEGKGRVELFHGIEPVASHNVINRSLDPSPGRQLSEEVYGTYPIIESIDALTEEVEKGDPALGSEEAHGRYLESYRRIFGNQVRVTQHRVDVGEGEMQAVGSVKVGDRSIMVYAGSKDPLLQAAVREYTEQLSLVEQIRTNLHIIEHADQVDPLTTLYNARAFKDQVEAALTEQGKANVYFFDLNDFKGFNELLGYQGADGLVQLVADVAFQSAAHFMQGEYAVARLMGDEFGVTSSEMSPKEFAAAQQKINQVIEIVLGTDPEQPLSRTGVDKDAFRVAEQIRPAILERVRSGEVKHLSWEKFSAALTAQRKGREGKVDGGVRLSGGMVVVSARDMRKFDGDIGAISIAAIKQAGELADAAKKQRKQDPGARQDIPVEHVQSYVERPPVLNHARSIWAQAVPL